MMRPEVRTAWLEGMEESSRCLVRAWRADKGLPSSWQVLQYSSQEASSHEACAESGTSSWNSTGVEAGNIGGGAQRCFPASFLRLYSLTVTTPSCEALKKQRNEAPDMVAAPEQLYDKWVEFFLPRPILPKSFHDIFPFQSLPAIMSLRKQRH